MKVKSESEVAQSCPTLRDPMDCSLPGSSIHGIFQARVLEWGAIAFSALMNSKTKWLLLVAQLVKNPPAMWETWVNPWVGKIPWRRERLPTPVFWSGEFHGLYSPWGCQELDMTEQL